MEEGRYKSQDSCSNCTKVASSSKASRCFSQSLGLQPTMPTPSEGGEDGRWASNAFLIFCMDTLVTIKILSKGTNFKEEKLA